jgi:ABC-type multidrug transport system fused ATPase/permease subunit
LGIARALYTKPKLLILDEATSALDGQAEASISNAIKALRGSVTVITIAHRISTVRAADKVIYLEKGLIKAMGTFDEVRAQVPDFDAQSKLMGL